MARAAEPQPAVRAGSATRILAVPPVEEVVPALLAGCRVIGDLVGRQPGGSGQLLRGIVESERRVIAGYDELARGMQRCKRRLRLDGELVKRQVSAGERKRVAQLGAPVVEQLPGPRIDEIEREAVEGGARNLYGHFRLGDRVDAPERFQDAVV